MVWGTRMAIGLSALRVEVLTDPASIGYASHVSAGNFNAITGLINSIPANSNAALSAITIGTVFSFQLQQAVVASEYINLTAPQRDLWNAALVGAVNGIAISNTVFRGQIAVVWSAGTTTRTNLALLQARRCSRAEALFGEGEGADVNQVGKAVGGDF